MNRAFVSYSGNEQGDFASALQESLEKYAKPFYQRRSCQVFLDRYALTPGDPLWLKIEESLDVSPTLILIATPQAAASGGVDHELRYWLGKHRDGGHLVIVLREGDAAWTSGDGVNDFNADAPLPPVLRGTTFPSSLSVDARMIDTLDPAFTEDLQFKTIVASVFAAVVRKTPGEVSSQAAREHLRTRRTIRGTIAALSVLAVLATGFGFYATAQRNLAVAQSVTLSARQLAAQSTALDGDDERLSQLMAAAAWRTQASSVTKRALIDAVHADPYLQRIIPLSSAPALIASGASEACFSMATLDRRILVWRSGQSGLRSLGTVNNSVTSIGVSGDCGTVMVGEGSAVRGWKIDGSRLSGLPDFGEREEVSAVAISADATSIAIAHSAQAPGSQSKIDLIDLANAHRTSRVNPFGALTASLHFGTKSRLLVVDEAYGAWQWWRTPDLTTVSKAALGLGAHQGLTAPSESGTYLGISSGAMTGGVWRTDGPVSQDKPAFVIPQVPEGSSIALSDQSQLGAWSSGGAVTVRALKGTNSLTLSGLNALTKVSFAGKGRYVIGASDSAVAIWDIDGLGRATSGWSVPIQAGCSACWPKAPLVSPDGKRTALVEGFGEGVVLWDNERHKQIGAYKLPLFGPAVFDVGWSASGKAIAVVVPPAGGVSVGSIPAPPSWLTTVTVDGSKASVSDTRVVDDELAVAWSDGKFDLRNITTGAVTTTWTAPGTSSIMYGGVGAAPGRVFFRDTSETRVFDLQGHELQRITDDGFQPEGFVGMALVGKTRDGYLAAVPPSKTQPTQLSKTQVLGKVFLPMSGSIVAFVSRHGLSLVDAHSGEDIGTIHEPDRFATLRRSGGVDGTRQVLVVAYENAVAPDGLTLLTERPLAADELVKVACSTSGGEPSNAEWTSLADGQQKLPICLR